MYCDPMTTAVCFKKKKHVPECSFSSLLAYCHAEECSHLGKKSFLESNLQLVSPTPPFFSSLPPY